jgi:hypothetical protein
VLGKAKVISYKDLVVKRTKREAKEQAKVKGKGKRGWKRKSLVEADALETDAPELGKGKRG